MICMPTWVFIALCFMFGCIAIYGVAMHFIAKGARQIIARHITSLNRG